MNRATPTLSRGSHEAERWRDHAEAEAESSNLAWGMRVLSPLLLRALREQIIISTGPHSCQYYSTDSFSGLLSPLVYRLFQQDIQQGFDAVAHALKSRAESI